VKKIPKLTPTILMITRNCWHQLGYTTIPRYSQREIDLWENAFIIDKAIAWEKDERLKAAAATATAAAAAAAAVQAVIQEQD
jgi:hypothetical protein